MNDLIEEFNIMNAYHAPHGDGEMKCPLGPELTELVGSLKVLTEKTETLITLNRDIIKWLLIVVCVIALGRSAFDVGKDLIAHASSPVTTAPQ